MVAVTLSHKFSGSKVVVFFILSLFLLTSGFFLTEGAPCPTCDFMVSGGLGGWFASDVMSSCTIFTVTAGDTVFFGNNEDYALPGTYVWLMPSQVLQLPSETISLHGVIFFGFDDNNQPVDGYPQGGMNDQGLCCDGNGLPEAPLNPYPEREMPYAYPFYQILWECSTVNDTIAWFKSHYLGSSLPGQFHFADATGDAVVISAGADGELAFTRMGTMTYLVSTNFNLANFGNGHYPCTRYQTACSMLDEVESESNLTIDVCRDVLEAVHQEGITAYSNIFDLVKRDIYIYQKHDFSQVTKLNLAEELDQVVPGAEGVISESPLLVKAIRIGDLFPSPALPFIGTILFVVCLSVGIMVIIALVIHYQKTKRTPK
jgi:hypothetical protein